VSSRSLVSVVLALEGRSGESGASLEECLRSLLVQSHSELEIIVVDSGASARTAEIVDAFTTRDSRVRVVASDSLSVQEQRGLGASRNRGAQEASGTYVMFIDPDDLVPSTSIATMAASLDASGSDFATGVVHEFNSWRSWRSTVSPPCFNHYATGTHITQVPDLVYDVAAPNKLIRRTFWQQCAYKFPEAVRFEDITLMLHAHFDASAVDVLPEVVYLARQHDLMGSSVIPAHRDAQGLADRQAALRASRQRVESAPSTALLRVFDKKLCEFDVMSAAREVPDATSEFRETFVEGYRPLVMDVADDLPLSMQARRVVQALRAGDRKRTFAWCGLASGRSATRNAMRALGRPGRHRRWRTRLRDVTACYVGGQLGRVGTAGQRSTRLSVRGIDVGRQASAVVGRAARVAKRRENATVNRATHDLRRLGVRVWTGYGETGILHTRLARLSRVLRSAGFDENGARFGFDPDLMIDTAGLRGCEFGTSIELVPYDGGWRAAFDALIESPDSSWDLLLRLRSGKTVLALGPLDMAPVNARSGPFEFAVRSSGRKFVNIVRRRAAPLAAFEWLEDRHAIRVAVDRDEGWSAVRLRHPQAQLTIPLTRIPVKREPSEWELVLGDARKYGDRVPLRRGRWIVEGSHEGRWWVLGAQIPSGHPNGEIQFDDTGAGVRYRIAAEERTINVRSSAIPRTEGRRWGMSQRRWAVEVPRKARRDPLRRTAVFECFYGRQVSCHPRALLEPIAKRLPDWDIYWVVSPGYTYAPEGTLPVLRWSREWYELCASSGLFIANCSLAQYFRRRPGQVVAQTWHGTPLKLLGFDMFNYDNFRAAYKREMMMQSSQWTHLISPSAFCSDIFPRAFAYDGPLLEVGSPRNDILVNGISRERAAQLRSNLGLGPEARVVLYAPTWRDDQKDGSDRVSNVPLDLASLAASLGDDVVILFRAHALITDMRAITEGPHLRNVSDYPDIQDLYLISDVLLTDYSSVMFDYACLDRPMVFHCPDLEHYRDELRGWYFDFEASSPGPITRSGAELRDALAAALEGSVEQQYLERASAFRSKFCAWEQGVAATQVADELVWSVDDSVAPGGRP
jgi:CDP-glycerol glycerophosphotransferase (TagB/SpsB family)